jgi:hypothetical protein
MAAALCRRRQQKGNGNYARAVHTRDVNADQTTQELRELRSRLAVCAAAIFHQQKLGKTIVENANYFAGAKDRCQEVGRCHAGKLSRKSTVVLVCLELVATEHQGGNEMQTDTRSVSKEQTNKI